MAADPSGCAARWYEVVRRSPRWAARSGSRPEHRVVDILPPEGTEPKLRSQRVRSAPPDEAQERE